MSLVKTHASSLSGAAISYFSLFHLLIALGQNPTAVELLVNKFWYRGKVKITGLLSGGVSETSTAHSKALTINLPHEIVEMITVYPHSRQAQPPGVLHDLLLVLHRRRLPSSSHPHNR